MGEKNFADLLVSTPIDTFIKLVKDEGEVDLNYASQKLNIPVSTLEDWATILQTEGIVEIKYGIYKVIVKWKGKTPEELTMERVKLEKEKKAVLEKGAELESKITSETKKSAEVEAVVKKALSSVDPIVKELRDILSRFSNLNDTLTAMLSMKSELKKLSSEVLSIQDDIAVTKTEAEELLNHIKNSKIDEKYKRVLSAKAEVDKLLNQLTEINNKLVAAKRELESVKVDRAKLDELERVADEIYEIESQIREFRSVHYDNIANLMLEISKQIDEKKKDAQEILAELKTNAETPEKLEVLLEKKHELESDVSTLIESLDSLQTSLSTVELPGKDELDKLEVKLEDASKKLESFGDIKEAIKEFNNIDRLLADLDVLTKKVVANKEKLAKEIGDFLATIDAEIESYKSYGRIKDKIVSSLEKYSQSLTQTINKFDDLSTKLDAKEKAFNKQLEALKQSLNEPSLMGKVDKLKAVIADIERVEKQSENLHSLRAELAQLERSASILLKEVELLNLFATTASAEGEGGESDINESKIEEKKEKIKDMLLKLWGVQDKNKGNEGNRGKKNSKEGSGK